MRKYKLYILILIALIGIFGSAIRINASVVNPNEACVLDGNGNIINNPCNKSLPTTTLEPPKSLSPSDTSYHLLAPLPCANGTPGCVNGKLETFDPTSDASGKSARLGEYLNLMIRIFIGICAVLAVVMIVVGGMEYMTTELISHKEHGKERIRGAIFGLVLALGAYALLYTINPDLLNSEVKIDQVTITVDLGGESPDPFVPLNTTSLKSLGINCPGGGKSAVGSIGQQFIGKTIYSMEVGRRNTISSSKIILDCSAFVDQVYLCAGLSNPGGNTAAIFSNGATSVDGKTYDFTKLHPGDLVGWKQGDNGSGAKVERFGHVAIYMGNGKILDTQPAGTAIRELSSIQSRITYVKWP